VKKVNYLQKFLSGDNALLKNNLVEVVEAKFFNDTALKLTDQSHQLIDECGVKIKRNRISRNNIIEPFCVLSRKLIFKEEMESRLGLIRNVLTENNLAITQKRLSSKNLPKGITILFHGEPGTGKTELVFQLAKETNRKIYKVDISQSKSLWYGESEKIIKRIFTDYTAFLKESEQVPILLFNEADAIFSARRELRASNVSQTENAVQNIILDELERFEGILMATTNLTGNFDAAFNRRFLFKVRFQKPDLISKAKIWKLKFPEISPEECNTLAVRFDFSGAQIDNILRKSEMHEIIHGKRVNFHSIVNYCQEENQLTVSTKIGFSKS
jgi:SpoVK/Ycf46/Vps4 family AAA+-type ATPase